MDSMIQPPTDDPCRALADISGDPEFDLFDATGGLTADALEFLAEIDRNGGFV